MNISEAKSIVKVAVAEVSLDYAIAFETLLDVADVPPCARAFTASRKCKVINHHINVIDGTQPSAERIPYNRSMYNRLLREKYEFRNKLMQEYHSSLYRKDNLYALALSRVIFSDYFTPKHNRKEVTK